MLWWNVDCQIEQLTIWLSRTHTLSDICCTF
jgi:hypothetical protein